MVFSERASEATILKETLNLIDEAVTADDFNVQDAGEIMKNRAYFETRYHIARKAAGQSIKSAQFVG